MDGTVLDAELFLEERRHAGEDPDAAPEAESFHTLGQQAGDLPLLVRGKSAGPSGRRTTPERSTPAFRAGELEPLADRTQCHTEDNCNVLLLPALLVQFPDAAATAFAPTDGLVDRGRVHTTMVVPQPSV